MDEMQQQHPTEVVEKYTNGAATASLVLGIIAVLTGLLVIGALFGIVSIILGIIGFVKARKRDGVGMGKSIAGIVMGVISMFLLVFAVILAALAIPRFVEASKKSKVSEAKLVLKQIWTASMTYYEEHGLYPYDHVFNDARTKNDYWNYYPFLEVDAPFGYPRFSYAIFGDGYNFEVVADPRESYDASVRDVSHLVIGIDGIIYGGTW